jgi:hypothetical protein
VRASARPGRVTPAVRTTLRAISVRAACSTRSSLLFSHTTNSSMIPNNRLRSASASVSGRSLPGSSTSEANSTARQAARGRRAHHKCRVLGCPWRIDFSRAASLLMASSGRATSMSFLR